MHAGEIVFAVVCGLWWVAALIGQSTSPRVMLWRSRDFLYLLPAYRFFASSPEFRDRVLEYRVRQSEQPDADAGPWQRISIDVPRGWGALLWYPHKIEPLYFEASAARLLEMLARHGAEAAATNRVCEDILRYVRTKAPQTADAAMQFQLRTIQGYDSAAAAVPCFRSRWHRLA